jgi:hypothetical protein
MEEPKINKNPLCEYGCGKVAIHQFKNGKWCCTKFIVQCSESRKRIAEKSKNQKIINKPKEIENLNHELCDYGCGKEAKFLFYNGKKCCCITQSSCKKIIEKVGKGSKLTHLKNPKIGQDQSQRMKNGLAKRMNTFIKPESREKDKKIMLEGKSAYILSFRKPESYEKMRQYMLDGGAAYAGSFVRNPSKPQVELYNRVKELYPSAEMNYPIYRGKGKHSYNLDVAIPELKIWFESDGLYYHKDKDYDLKREEEIKELGWKIIRYIADNIKQVKSIDQIKSDILSKINS